MQNLAEKTTVKLIKIKKMPGVDTSVGNVAGSFGTLHFGLPKITVSDRGLAFGGPKKVSEILTIAHRMSVNITKNTPQHLKHHLLLL